MTIELTSEIGIEIVQRTGGDHTVVHAARVSTRGASCREDAGSKEEQYGLIRYLMRHRHGTPFEHGLLTFFVHAPIFVFREWHRHRIGHSYNESSARYRELEPVFWIPHSERKMIPSSKHTPARPQFVKASEEVYQSQKDLLFTSYVVAWNSYQKALMLGVAKEVARACLPVGIYSSCWVTVNPRSLMSFLSLRTHDDQATYISYPQAEIEEAAKACEEAFRQGWPLTHRAFCECGRVAP